jgi:nucleoside-diphosphate-sugar epimerase
MKALVTGATGFIGGHIADALLSAGHSVRALVRATSDVERLRGLGVELAAGDLTDVDCVARACHGADCVFHAAAMVSAYGDWAEYERVGVRGTQHVIDGAAAARVSRFVHLSSIAVYGTRQRSVHINEHSPLDEHPEPWNHYVREKVESEKLVWKAHAAGEIRATCLRPSIVLGPRDRNAAPRFLKALSLPLGRLLGGAIGRGNNRVPCVAVEDLAALAVEAAASEAAVGRAYNASAEELITQREFLRACSKSAGAGLRVHIPFPRSLAWASASVLEGAWRVAGQRQEPILSRFSVALMSIDALVDSSRARRDLGWRAERDLRHAIQRSMQWHAANT